MKSSLRLCLVACCLVVVGCVSGGDCSSPYANSLQFKGCLFANPPNPLTPPGAGTWTIWSRFIFSTKVGTVPVDPIPVQPLTTAHLEALDPQSNHIVRLGHSSHLLKQRGKFWLIDPVFGERVSPVSFASPKRFHAPPLTLQRPGLPHLARPAGPARRPGRVEEHRAGHARDRRGDDCGPAAHQQTLVGGPEVGRRPANHAARRRLLAAGVASVFPQ